jgi:hypothetical protein
MDEAPNFPHPGTVRAIINRSITRSAPHARRPSREAAPYTDELDGA